MLPQSKIDEVRHYLSLGTYSQRMISRITGVSRVVVHRIATGKRKDRAPPVKEPWEIEWGTKAERCPVCGARVKLPCMACIIRSVSEAVTSPYPEVDHLKIELELKDEHRIRYEQIRAWREMQGDPNFAEIPTDWPFRKRFNRKSIKGQHRKRPVET